MMHSINNKKRHVRAILIAGLFSVSFFVFSTVHAADQTTLSQKILGVFDTIIIDRNGIAIDAPVVDFAQRSEQAVVQESDAIFGNEDLRIRMTNTSANIDTWTLTIAAQDGATALWSSGLDVFDYNDAAASGYDSGDLDSAGGQLQVDPSVGTVRGLDATTIAQVTLGKKEEFKEGKIDSIDLLIAASGADTPGEWELTGVALEQSIPPEQMPGLYVLDMILTVS